MSAQIPTIFGIIKDVITTGAACVGVRIAWLGLTTWQRQLKGNTHYELARRLLRAVYRVRDEIEMVRSPLIISSEQAAAFKEAGVNESDQTAKDGEALVYSRRWSRLATALSDLDLERLEAEVLWGSAVKNELKPLDDCVRTLYFTINEYLREKSKPMRHLDDNDVDRASEIDRVIYRTGDAADSFTREILNAVEKFENYIRPNLKL